MKTKRAGVRAILRQVEHSLDRSPLFYWLVENHDALVGQAKGRRLRWVDLCPTFAALGLTNQRGGPATAETARMTWYRARKEVARQRAHAAAKAATGLAPRSLMPSARPATWQPTPLATRPAAGLALGQPTPSPSASLDRTAGTMPGVGGPVSDDVVQARLAALRRTLDERSGR